MPSTVVDPYTSYTLSTLRALVLRKLRVLDTSRYSPTKGTADYDWVDEALNTALLNFAKETKYLRAYALIQLHEGYRAYSAPRGFMDIMSAYLYESGLDNGYKKLSIKTIDEMNNEFSDYRTKEGEPTTIYIDRKHGIDASLGMYPIPNESAGTDPFTSNTGDVYDWICTLFLNNRDFAFVQYVNGDVKYVLPNTTAGVVADMEINDYWLLLEYYQLPIKLRDASQQIDMPYDYQDTIATMAAGDLLENNPEDSAEFKRSMALQGKGDRDISRYVKERKVPQSGQAPRAQVSVWGWQANMDYRKEMF